MSARVVLDLSGAIPPYEQIRAQLAGLIAVGKLAPGTRLPTIRMLALDLGVAAGTVGRAYKELEAAGLIETRRRHGTVVTEHALPPNAPGQRGNEKAVLAAVENLIDRGRAAGLDDATMVNLLTGRLNQLRNEPSTIEGEHHGVG